MQEDGMMGTDRPRRELRLPAATAGEIRRRAIRAWPDEACGILLGHSGGTSTTVVLAFPAGNRDREARGSRYTIDPADHLAARRWAGERGLEVVGFWHSHPNRPAVPSALDRAAAWRGVSYLIVSVREGRAGEPRSWRLSSGRFEEEAVQERSHGIARPGRAG
jgi:proteasome lid subunit RPN8/RPN11